MIPGGSLARLLELWALLAAHERACFGTCGCRLCEHVRDRRKAGEAWTQVPEEKT